MINDLAKQIHKNNVEKGFYEVIPSIAERIALIHSEVSEALEADRAANSASCSASSLMCLNDEDFNNEFKFHVKDSFQDEIADSIIRLLDLSAQQEIDIESHIAAKVRYNTLRPYKHGKNY